MTIEIEENKINLEENNCWGNYIGWEVVQNRIRWRVFVDALLLNIEDLLTEYTFLGKFPTMKLFMIESIELDIF